MRIALCCVALAFLPGLARAADLKELLETRTFTDGSASLEYRLMKPAEMDPKQKYPLVVFLHGAGERGSDNTAQLRHGVPQFASEENRKKYPCFLIAPQCPAGKVWALGKDKKGDPQPGQMVLDLIPKVEKEFPIDPKRVYLTGLSMGGYGTWMLLAKEPELFAAGIPICGGGDEKQAETLAKVPIWAFHGDKDTAVKVDRSRNMIAAIKKAGGTPKYTEYPGVGHDSWTQTYKNPEVFAWLFAQKK